MRQAPLMPMGDGVVDNDFERRTDGSPDNLTANGTTDVSTPMPILVPKPGFKRRRSIIRLVITLRLNKRSR